MLNSHTHCQAAPANATNKVWQRVCLFQSATDNNQDERSTPNAQQSVYDIRVSVGIQAL